MLKEKYGTIMIFFFNFLEGKQFTKRKKKKISLLNFIITNPSKRLQKKKNVGKTLFYLVKV